MRTSVIAALVGLLLISGSLHAGDLQTQTYRGWVEQDRWGDLWLSNGMTALRLTAAAVPHLRPFIGKAVEVKAGALPSGLQEASLDAPLGVTAAQTVLEQPSLSLVPNQASLPVGTAAFIQLTIAFSGTGTFRFRHEDVRLHLRRKGIVRAEGQEPTLSSDENQPWPSGGASTTILEDGTEDATWAFTSPGVGLLTGRGELNLYFEVAVRAPEGTYEIWATFGGGTLSRDPAPRIRRLPLDIKSERRPG